MSDFTVINDNQKIELKAKVQEIETLKEMKYFNGLNYDEILKIETLERELFQLIKSL